jgi:hypothetical protein
MAEFVEAGGRYEFDPATNTVRTVMTWRDSDGKIVSEARYVTTVQIFLAWAAQMRAVEQEILRHQARQNIVELGDFRRVADGE